MAKDRISISCASDHNYFCGLLVTCVSIVRFSKVGSAFIFHVLDGGLTEEDRSLLPATLQASPNWTVEVCYHIAEVSQFEQLKAWRGNHVAYARLFLQDLLANEDATIYTDVDTLWLRDVNELWQQLTTTDSTLHAVSDGAGNLALSSEKAFCKRFHLSRPEGRYFCSGLIGMNLKQLRAMNFTQLVLETCKTIPEKLEFPDQDLYNLLCPPECVTLLDLLWGEFSTIYGQRGTMQPRVLHYAKAAPWTSKHLSAAQMLWWNFLAKDIGFDALGSIADVMRSRYKALHRYFTLLRVKPIFFFVYGFAALFNRKVFRKKYRAIYPEG